MKSTSANAVISKLEELIAQNKGNINPYEAALATGFSIDEINDAFNRLLELFESKVSMDSSSGAVVFKFAYPLKPRGKKTFKEKLYVVAEAAYKIFQKVYKVSIGVILIAYTTVFALIILAAMFASSSRDNDRGPNLGFVADIFLAIIRGMQIAAITSDMAEMSRDRSGLAYRQVRREPQKGFITSVYHFVFGPERVKFDPLADAREVLAYLKQVSNGKLTAGSIIMLSGGNYESAESKLAEYVGKFKGDMNITNDGLLLAEFHNLQSVQKEWLKGKIIYYFDEVEAPYILNGNTAGKNIGISFMNFFNLLVSMVVMAASTNAAMFIFLGLLPFIFSVLFFAIPLIRIPVNISLNKKREKEILRKKLFRGIAKTMHHPVTLEELLAASGISGDEVNKAKDMVQSLLIDYQGELTISESGAPLYIFERLNNEIKVTTYTN